MTKFKIQISLDGYDSDSYYSIRGNRAFEKVIYNAVLCSRLGLNVCFRTTLSEITINEYERFINISKETGIPLKIKPMINMEKEISDELHLEMEKLARWYEDIRDKGYYEYAEGSIFDKNYRCSLLNAPMNISSLYIDEKGDMFPCLALQNEIFKLGNMNDFNYTLFDSKLKDVREYIRECLHLNKCKECGYRSMYSSGECIAACLYGKEKCFNITIGKE